MSETFEENTSSSDFMSAVSFITETTFVVETLETFAEGDFSFATTPCLLDAESEAMLNVSEIPEFVSQESFGFQSKEMETTCLKTQRIFGNFDFENLHAFAFFLADFTFLCVFFCGYVPLRILFCLLMCRFERLWNVIVLKVLQLSSGGGTKALFSFSKTLSVNLFFESLTLKSRAREFLQRRSVRLKIRFKVFLLTANIQGCTVKERFGQIQHQVFDTGWKKSPHGRNFPSFMYIL